MADGFTVLSLLRATFGQNVGPFRKQVGTGVEFYFEGMAPKDASASVATAPTSAAPQTHSPVSTTSAPAADVPGSPILKAQLCAPPKATTRKDAPKTVSCYPSSSAKSFLSRVEVVFCGSF